MRHEQWGEPYTTGVGQKLRVHKREDCRTMQGRWACVIHMPPPESAGWRTHWREGRRHRPGRHQDGFMVILCAHDVGHVQGRDHGCDGCCSRLEVLEGELAQDRRELTDGFTVSL